MKNINLSFVLFTALSLFAVNGYSKRYPKLTESMENRNTVYIIPVDRNIIISFQETQTGQPQIQIMDRLNYHAMADLDTITAKAMIAFLSKRLSRRATIEPKNGEAKIFLKWISFKEVELEITQYDNGRNVLGYLDTETIEKILRILNKYSL